MSVSGRGVYNGSPKAFIIAFCPNQAGIMCACITYMVGIQECSFSSAQRLLILKFKSFFVTLMPGKGTGDFSGNRERLLLLKFSPVS